LSGVSSDLSGGNLGLKAEEEPLSFVVVVV
jgi:hypothetical protein